MNDMLWLAPVVVMLNLPFGFWRAGVRKFSFSWFVAVHGPIPVVWGLRIGAGLGWSLATFAVLVSCYFTGQFLGGRLHAVRVR